MAKRIINVWWDILNERFLNENNQELGESGYPAIFYREKPLLRLRVVLGDISIPYLGLSAVATRSAVIDLDFSESTEPFVQVADSDINVAGDWEVDSAHPTGQADVENGEISMRLNGYDGNFLSRIGASPYIDTTQMEFQEKEYGTDDTMTVFRIPFVVRNLMNKGGLTPPTPVEDYVLMEDLFTILGAEREFQFSVDGETDWHSSQESSDMFYRERYPTGLWSVPIEMIVGPEGDPASVPEAIHAAETKATPVDADEFGFVDTEASNVLKKFTWANIKSVLYNYLAPYFITSTGTAQYQVPVAGASPGYSITLTVPTGTGIPVFDHSPTIYGTITVTTGSSAWYIRQASNSLDTSADAMPEILITGSGGSAPFTQVGNLVYKARVSSTAGRSCHYWYTGNPCTLRMTLNELGNLSVETSGAVLSVGASTKLYFKGDYGGSGEMPAGVYGGSSAGGYTIIAGAVSPSTYSVGMSYYTGTGTTWLSAISVANVASGYSNLKLMKSGGNVGIGLGATSPTARLHLPAGSTAASSAPAKMTSGDLNTVPEVGAWEFLTDALYFTITTGAVRKTIAFLEDMLVYLSGKKAHNGFEDRTATLSMNGANLKITGNHNVWSNGTKYEKTTAELATAYTGENYFYYNTSGVLSVTDSVFDIISDNSPVSIVYKTPAGRYNVFEERHGHKRDRDWHRTHHLTVGALWDYGLVLTSTPGALATFSISAGRIWDEDIPGLVSIAQTACKVWWRDSGGSYMERLASTSEYLAYISGGSLYYDNGSGVTAATNNKYVCYYVYATMDVETPIYVVCGQNEHTTVALARNDTLPSFNGMTTREFRLLYRVIWKNSATPEYVEAADYRSAPSLPGGSVTSLYASSIIVVPYGNISSITVQAAIAELDDEKQALLVSGTNIKTINGASILGSGDLATPGGNGTAQYQIMVTGASPFTPTYMTATGTGSPVLATSPQLVTPNIGVASATSINSLTLSTGSNNRTGSIALGDHALYSTTSSGATDNFAAGRYAMGSGDVTGNDDICIGQNAGRNLTSGSCNILIGVNSGDAISTKHHNVSIGNAALSGSAGDGNVAVGAGAGGAATGNYSVHVGWCAGKYNTEDYAIYLDVIDRNTTAGDKANAPIYVVASTSGAAYQTVTINATLVSPVAVKLNKSHVAWKQANGAVYANGMIHGRACVGNYTYTGNATERSINCKTGTANDGTDFAAHFAWCKSATAVTGAMWTCLGMSKGYAVANLIDAFLYQVYNGFRIGGHDAVNTNSAAYQFVAFGAHDGSLPGMKLAYGRYQGNASDNRGLTGLGFQPEGVAVKGAGTQQAVFRTANNSGDATSYFLGNVANIANSIQSLDADGFTIGTHASVNTNAVWYYWIAWQSSAEGLAEIVVRDYTGKAGNGVHVDLPFEPHVAFVIPAGALGILMWNAIMDPGKSAYVTSATANASDGIIGFDEYGLIMGSGTEVNTVQNSVCVVAFKSDIGQIDLAG